MQQMSASVSHWNYAVGELHAQLKEAQKKKDRGCELSPLRLICHMITLSLQGIFGNTAVIVRW